MDDSKKRIKVTDKRIFTPEGDVREDYVPDPPKEESAHQAGADTKTRGPSLDSPSREPTRESSQSGFQPDENAPPTLFMALADNLIVSAYAAMGMVPGPDGSRPRADLEATRQMISLLEMLEEKTEGNLDAREANYLKTHLGELKLAFVRINKGL